MTAWVCAQLPFHPEGAVLAFALTPEVRARIVRAEEILVAEGHLTAHVALNGCGVHLVTAAALEAPGVDVSEDGDFRARLCTEAPEEGAPSPAQVWTEVGRLVMWDIVLGMSVAVTLEKILDACSEGAPT